MNLVDRACVGHSSFAGFLPMMVATSTSLLVYCLLGVVDTNMEMVSRWADVEATIKMWL